MGKKPKQSKYEKYKELRKNNERSEIEGKFGAFENCKHAITTNNMYKYKYDVPGNKPVEAVW